MSAPEKDVEGMRRKEERVQVAAWMRQPSWNQERRPQEAEGSQGNRGKVGKHKVMQLRGEHFRR